MFLVRVDSSLLLFKDAELFKPLAGLLSLVELALPFAVLAMLI